VRPQDRRRPTFGHGSSLHLRNGVRSLPSTSLGGEREDPVDAGTDIAALGVKTLFVLKVIQERLDVMRPKLPKMQLHDAGDHVPTHVAGEGLGAKNGTEALYPPLGEGPESLVSGIPEIRIDSLPDSLLSYSFSRAYSRAFFSVGSFVGTERHALYLSLYLAQNCPDLFSNALAITGTLSLRLLPYPDEPTFGPLG